MIFDIVFGVLCVGCVILCSYRAYKDYAAYFKRKKISNYKSFLKTLRLLRDTNKSGDLIKTIEGILYFYDNEFQEDFQVYCNRMTRRDSKRRVNMIMKLLNEIRKS